MLMTRNLHTKSSEISIKTRSPPAPLSFRGQATKHTTVEWSSIAKMTPFHEGGSVGSDIYDSIHVLMMKTKVK